jgi:ABC-type uncharacterized transport system ATPase subunit
LENEAILRLVDIRKEFGALAALDGVYFSIQSVGIHGLLGENGAGKTTLMNILFGLYRPDQGDVLLRGKKVHIGSPGDAIRLGIGMVHQFSTMVPEFTAVENIVMGTASRRFSLSIEREEQEIARIARELGMSFPFGTKVKELPAGVKQKIEIVRSLYRGARLIILDEPTTYLVESEFRALLKSLRSLVERGITVILITHKIREVMEACDTVTVMRKGRIEGVVGSSDMSEEKLVKLMFTEKEIAITESALPQVAVGPCRLSEKPIVRVEGIRVEGGEKRTGLADVSFEIHGGEILGVASISGNGEKELADVMVDPSRLAGGSIFIDGECINQLSTVEVFARGVFYTPEERVKEGILTEGTVTENLLLGHQNEKRFRRNGLFIDWNEVGRAARKAISDYNIHTPGPDFPIKRLSGGNIQKVIIGRALLGQIRFLVTHNPTVGLDISSVEFIFRKLVEIRNDCGAVLWINEDLDELMQLSDRIAVLHGGKLAGVFRRSEFDKYSIGLLMIGAGS